MFRELAEAGWGTYHQLFYCLVVTYFLLIFINGSGPLDVWLRLNLAGKWKLRENEDYVTLWNSGLYLLSILHHLYKVLWWKNIILEINAVEKVFSEKLMCFPFWTVGTIINHRGKLVTYTYPCRYSLVLQHIVLNRNIANFKYL